MSVRFADLVRESSRELSLRELLEQPVTELIGVSAAAASALSSLTIGSIFDLGTSSVFARASAALAAADSDVQLVPQDILGTSGAGVPPEDVPGLPLGRLHGVSQAVASALTAALSVSTIRELALWPPRRVAHEMVGVALGTDLGDTEERAADELRPAFGEYPTERVYYDTLFMLGTDAAQAQQPLSAPLSLAKLVQRAGVSVRRRSTYAFGLGLRPTRSADQRSSRHLTAPMRCVCPHAQGAASPCCADTGLPNGCRIAKCRRGLPTRGVPLRASAIPAGIPERSRPSLRVGVTPRAPSPSAGDDQSAASSKRPLEVVADCFAQSDRNGVADLPCDRSA